MKKNIQTKKNNKLTLAFSATAHREGVGRNGRLNLRVVEVDDGAIILDHVNLKLGKFINDKSEHIKH